MDDPADRALAAALAGWLTALLAGAGADLRPDQAVLADAVHRTLPALFHHRVFPERHADLTARLRAVFTADPPRLGPTADAADLRAAVTAAVVPLTSDPFYRFPMHDLPDVVLRIAHDAVSRLAALTGVACPPAALARLGFTDHAAALSNAITGTVHGPVVQAGVVHGDVTLVVGEEEPDIPLVTTVQTKLAHGYRTSRGRVGLTGSTSIAITVEALVARAVILTALRPVVLRRATPDPGPGWVALGTLTPRTFTADLDPDPPHVRPEGPDFPFTVAPLDPEQFVIHPRTDRAEIDFVLELHWLHRGRAGTTVIDDDGEPFRVAPRLGSGAWPS